MASLRSDATSTGSEFKAAWIAVNLAFRADSGPEENLGKSTFGKLYKM